MQRIFKDIAQPYVRVLPLPGGWEDAPDEATSAIRLNLKKSNVVIPGGDERVFAMICGNELAFAVPKERIRNLVEGIKDTHDTDVARIPTPFFRRTADPEFPSCYEGLDRYAGIKE